MTRADSPPVLFLYSSLLALRLLTISFCPLRDRPALHCRDSASVPRDVLPVLTAFVRFGRTRPYLDNFLVNLRHPCQNGLLERFKRPASQKDAKRDQKLYTMCVVGRIPQTPILNSVSGRRRKIRCTFNPDRPEACNECRLRGSTCIDQEHDSDKPKASDAAQGDQRYSLRERVAHLENIVEDLAKRLNETSPTHSQSEFMSYQQLARSYFLVL